MNSSIAFIPSAPRLLLVHISMTAEDETPSPDEWEFPNGGEHVPVVLSPRYPDAPVARTMRILSSATACSFVIELPDVSGSRLSGGLAVQTLYSKINQGKIRAEPELVGTQLLEIRLIEQA